MPQSYVIFGASGDLTSRKLVPALYNLFRKQRLPQDTRVVGFSRTPHSHDEWRESLRESTAKFVGAEFDADIWGRFAPSIYYQPGDIGHADDFAKLAQLLDELDAGQDSTRIYYLATAPQFYEPAVEQLGAAGLADESHGPRRIVIEKPFGRDLESAKVLNAAVHGVFREKQVYRIDHYLGKETVQNIMVLRFANSIFEPLWNRTYIDHVQITAAEEVDVGNRGPYYDSSGTLRDMFQNHLLQLLTVTTMEAPNRFEADAIRNEKVKVLDAIRPLRGDGIANSTFRGQYDGYRQAPGVAPDSRTETFAAVRLQVDNWRWQGVPFYLRSGKALSCRTSQIVIQFRRPPHLMFNTGRPPEPNRLLIQIQPAEGLQIHFQSKVPDAGMKMREGDLEFRFDSRFQKSLPDAYERLLLDTLSGDASLFSRSDEVELAWRAIDPILQCWSSEEGPPVHIYEPGTWGPIESNDWPALEGRQWFDVCPVLS